MSSFTVVCIIVFIAIVFKVIAKVFPAKNNDVNDDFDLIPHPLSKTKEYEQNLPLPDEFVAIDVETATDKPNSICQIGLAVVKNSEIVETKSWLVRPPKNEYSQQNIAIHGITPDMTEKAPGMAKLYPTLAPYLENQPLAAHYAHFDSRCLRSALSLSRKNTIVTPYYLDSCIAARRAYPNLKNHKLPTVCDHLNIKLDDHHNAESDAIACAHILTAIGKSPRIVPDHVTDKTAYDCYSFNRAPNPIRVYHQTWNEKYGNK